MAALNRVMVLGNLTKDPELRKTNGGTVLANLGLAVTDGYTNKAGEQVETICFVDITVWDRMAEACKKYLGKGSPVLVEGRLETDTWETPQGEKRSKLRVRADRVQFLGRPRDGSKAPAPAESSAQKSNRRPAQEEPAEAVNF